MMVLVALLLSVSAQAPEVSAAEKRRPRMPRAENRAIASDAAGAARPGEEAQGSGPATQALADWREASPAERHQMLRRMSRPMLLAELQGVEQSTPQVIWVLLASAVALGGGLMLSAAAFDEAIFCFSSCADRPTPPLVIGLAGGGAAVVVVGLVLVAVLLHLRLEAEDRLQELTLVLQQTQRAPIETLAPVPRAALPLLPFAVSFTVARF